MPVRDSLPAVLRGDLAADVSPASRAQLEALAHEAQNERQLAAVRDELGSRLKQPSPSFAVDYLLAAVCALNGEVERASQSLLILGDKLKDKKKWEPLAAVAERALALVQSHAAARLLVAAHEGLKKDPDRIDALGRAWAIMPEDLELALLLAQRLGEAGEHADRRALLAELMPRFAEEGRHTGLEEAALEFVEHDDWEGLVHLVQTLPTLATAGSFKEAKQLADIIVPALGRSKHAGGAVAPLREVVARAIEANGPAAAESFRKPLIEALRQGPGSELPDAARVITDSGLEDADVDVASGLARFDLIAALPPGRAVLHDSFGAGRVVSNDTEMLVLHFARSQNHKMPYAAARRTLVPILEDDLRLLQFTDPAEIKRLRSEDQGTMVVRALRALGGAADAQKLKVFLIGSNLVPAGEWTTFFRKARAAAEKDPRIDHARAFEQHYQLATENAADFVASADDTPLPPIEVRKPVKSNLTTIKKFLAQHPDAETPLARRFGRYIERAMHDEDGELGDRARSGLYFAKWFPERRGEWLETLKKLWQLGLNISDLSTEDDQLALLEDSRACDVEAEAILSALDSRFAAVRDVADKGREQLDAQGKARMRRALLDRPAHFPAAALRLIEGEFDIEPRPDDSWRLMAAALALIEDAPKASTAEKVLRWLEDYGPFERMLAGQPCPEEIRLKLRVLLRQWRSSDRYLFPALDAVARFGLAEEKEWVLDHRQKKTDKLFDQVGKQVENVDIPMMTRATWTLLKAELERLERELRTTIPATIQKARELGDLRENAEYHSAKLKQANVSKQVATLQLRLARARFIEDADVKDGVVGLGSQVVLESEKDLVTYWILGDGEQHHGEHVVSFQAPIGRALMGRGIGEELDLGEGVSKRRYRVVSVEHRLPPHEQEQESGSAT